jgi:8-oxo-dGTP pyrophosphatase MutT (NUDIX family)
MGWVGAAFEEEDFRRLLRTGTNLNQFQELELGSSLAGLAPFRSAAVLVPLFCQDNQWNVLFTRRTDLVQDHKGQVAFPGGSTESEDGSPEDTALREAYEEIGLLPADVKIVGQLQLMITGTGFQVTPVIGIIPWPYSFTTSILEVSRIFSIPLEWLADPGHYSERIFYRSEADPTPHKAIFFEPYDGETLWGVSARITVNFLEVLNLIQR